MSPNREPSAISHQRRAVLPPLPLGEGRGEGASTAHRPLPAAYFRGAHCREAASRRGVLLLIVLSLLLLFVMIGVAYVLVASRHLRSNIAIATKDSVGQPANQILLDAVSQVLRGSGNFHSAAYPHSLLEDIYGNKTIFGVVRSPNVAVGSGYPRPLSQGAILELASQLTGTSENSSLTSIYEPDDYFDGCVITMTSGAAKGISARVIKSYRGDISGTPYEIFRVLSVSGGGLPVDGDTFVINGRAFLGNRGGLESLRCRLAAQYDQHLRLAHG